MPPEEVNFQTFFVAKLKDRGVSIKKLAEATGIAPAHLEAMAHGKFDNLPSSPYLHGYIIRIGKVLDFDGAVWWEKMKQEGLVKNSGPVDSFPSNRFVKQSHQKFIWAGVAGVIIIIYLAFQLPVIFGKPALTITSPDANPFTTASSTLTMQGTAHGADSLYLTNANASDTEAIVVTPDGSWQKTVLLQSGVNTFKIAASKLLSGETDFTQQIIYTAPGLPATATSSAASSSAPTAPAAFPSGTRGQ